MRTLALTCIAILASSASAQAPPLVPLQPDAHTLLLYHFDDGAGSVAKDAGGHGYDGEVRGAAWTKGRFGGGLQFDGAGSSVFRKMTEAIVGLKQFTVECWYKQDNPSGRQFLMGKDVTFHCDLVEGHWSSLSLYNQGGEVANAEGKPHQQVGGSLGAHSGSRWNHLAASYDGSRVSVFLNGVLTGRHPAPRDFSIGTNSRGFWVGCYVGMDYWFSGIIDEVRISDCVRYDPEAALPVGSKAFDAPGPKLAVKAVRTAIATGKATLSVTVRKLYGTDAAGWVYLKPPGRKAAIVGRYEMKGLKDGEARPLRFDVSDEAGAAGCHVLALEPTDTGAYIAVTKASLSVGGMTAASWTGHAKSRRTFAPAVLVALRTAAPAKRPLRAIALEPKQADRVGGNLEVADGDAPGTSFLSGDGYAEWWVDAPERTAYRISMRYAAAGRRPCDIVIDGADLNDYTMCALNTTGGSSERDAFWEVQGAVRLSAGVHWIRVQDMPPNVYGLRLDPIAALPARAVPFAPYPVPSGDFLAARPWTARALTGSSAGARATAAGARVAFAASLHPGASVRLSRRVRANLEPYGAVRFTFAGTGSGHVATVRLVDAKGDEKLVWRARDRKAGPVEVSAPLLFEGMDVFDGRHVAEVCLDLDEGNLGTGRTGVFAGSLAGVRFVRRDALAATTARSGQDGRAPGGDPKGAPALKAPRYTPWVKPVVPEEHPLFASTEPKPVRRETLGYKLRFTGSRDVSADQLDQFHKLYRFGDVCWPHIGILPQQRDYKSDADYRKALVGMEERLRDVEGRGLFLFDIWGYVPFGEAGPTPRVAPEHHEALTRIFGDRFLGYDNGEQDGRYIGSYADRGTFTDRRGGYADFVKWDQGICDDNMGFMNATGSLNFSHYYGERGARTLGLETAQGLPSDTLMFGFLRGASKQYGRLTAQATSVWNRFGYNIFSDRRTEGGGGYGLGPNKGCSLSLHKRLFFSSYTGGDSICGSETAQFTADRLANGANELSPLGRQHLRIADWTAKHPDRGVMCAPVAFMLDFYHGWNMPRHLYRGDMYKIWGKLPYEKGDYQIDAMFRMVWPGYEDASYLRNERGFLSPTPYGDVFDVLTNRCHPEVLKQYASIILLGGVEMTPELVASLDAYVRAGGDLVIDAVHARALPAELVGAVIASSAGASAATRLRTGGPDRPEQPFTYLALTPSSARPMLFTGPGDILMTVNSAGKGRVVVIGADCWMTDRLTYADPKLVHMEPPYRMLEGVRSVLDGYLSGFSPVTATPSGLTVRTSYYEKDRKRMLIGLFNNELFADWKGAVTVRGAQVLSAKDTWHGTTLKIGSSGISLTVPAGDVAMVEVRLK